MEEKERNYETPLGVPGGHNLPFDDCIGHEPARRDDGCDDGRRKNFKAGGRSLTLPRYVKSRSDGDRAENGEPVEDDTKSTGRKVDSLPSNITMLSLEQEKKFKKKGVLKSVGHFIQKIARRFSISGNGDTYRTKFGQRGSSSAGSSNSSNGGSGSASDCRGGSSRRSEDGSMTGSSHAADRGKPVPNCHLTLDEIPGMIGIHNHGNTCFMNAVVQCLSNTEPLLGYFLSDQYKEDIKRANKHNSKRFGTRGELTEHLATLLKSLWLKKYTSEISTEFRSIVGKYGPQYRGSFQHDVQEFLMWLLDKVHEDLNIATKKKYRANKSSFGRSDEEVAAEASANHARCNKSFIHDLFQALYMSSLTCPSCRHRSNTFDPFLSVSLPIPRASPVRPLLATCLGSGRPRRMGMVLEKGHSVGDLKEEATSTFFVGRAPSELLVMEVTGKNEFHLLLDDSRLLEDPTDDDYDGSGGGGGLLYVIDISSFTSIRLKPQGVREKISSSSFSSSSSSLSVPNSNDRGFPSKEELRTSSGGGSEVVAGTRTKTNGVAAGGGGGGAAGAGGGGGGGGGSRELKISSRPASEVPACPEKSKEEEGEGEGGVPEMVLVVIMSSMPWQDEERKSIVPSLLQLPLSLLSSERVESVVKDFFKMPEETEGNFYLITDGGSSNFVKLEIPREADGNQEEMEQVGRSMIQSAASSLEVNGLIIPVFRLLVEWKDHAFKRHFLLADEVEEDASVQKAMKLQLEANVGTLDECFQVYTQEEMLGEDNDWHCPSCMAPKRGATKSLTLWSLPEILVIHLKRFRQDHEHRSKINTLIRFPLTGLDLRHHMPQKVAEGEEWAGDQAGASGLGGNWNAAMQLKNNKRQSSWLSWRLGCKTNSSDLYDLYAVCNHYGDMQGGHYTVTDTWCLFNDGRASRMAEEEVVTRAAYLLFYRKRSVVVPPPAENGETGDARAGGVRRSDPSGPVVVPLSSVESRPWLVALLEERRKLHGLSHRISRAITSHSLDDLLDGECDDSRENDFQGVPVYTTLHPPPRIKKQTSKAPTPTVSTDSVPMATVGGGSPTNSEMIDPSRSIKNEEGTSTNQKKKKGEEEKEGEKACPSPCPPPQMDVGARLKGPAPSASKGDDDDDDGGGGKKKSSLPPKKVKNGSENLTPAILRQKLMEGID